MAQQDRTGGGAQATLPWGYDPVERAIVGDDGAIVCDFRSAEGSDDEIQENRELIVRAVNSHAPLYDALRELLKIAMTDLYRADRQGFVKQASAAIAKAEGRQP